MILALTLGALAVAAPPRHVRAVALPPRDFSELDGAREVRVWWDEDGAPKQVELMRGGAWRVIAADAQPGVSVGRLPPGAVLRVRSEDEASEAVAVARSLGPDGLARLSAPAALPGLEVADIHPTEAGAWVALQEGGLAFVPMDALTATPWGRAEGLPSSRVLSVLGDGERLWVGTDAGLALAEGGRVVQVWTTQDGLPDDWVQALALGHNEDVWVGTYGGLAQLRLTGAVQQHLGAEPVFSLTPAGEGGPWVGSEGLHLGDTPVAGVPSDLAVWDVDLDEGRLYLATDSEGVLRLEEGLLLPYWRPRTGAAYALHRQRGLLYVASDTAGLVAVSEREGPLRAWGVAEGLPGDAVYEVVGGPPGKLWVGTDRGLALLWPDQDIAVPWPSAPLAAGRPQAVVLGEEDFALIGGPEGLVALGRLPRAWRDALALPGPVVHLASSGRALWVVGPEQAWRVARGRVQRFPLPIEASHAALVGETLFIGGPEGAMRYDLAQERFVAMAVQGPVADLQAGPEGLCWIAAGRAVIVADSGGQQRVYPLPRAPRALAPGGEQVWIASGAGLERLNPASGERDAPLGALGPAQDLALDPEGHPLLLGEDGALFDAFTGVLLAAPAQTAEVGEGAALHVDAEGRVWLSGDRGAMLVAR
ncbi:MAG: hypothetical protein H6741_33885 [Alphaproteobacteria bacterium]|nr:hypothetical protein [Alphaproteobacteria bacterium]